MMTRFLHFFTLVMSIAAAQAFECSYTTPDGRYVYNELSKLTRTTDFMSFDGIYWYTLNVCGFSNNKNCSGVHGSICTLTRDGMVIDAIGQFGAGREPYWTVTYENQPQVGVTLSFDNGKFDGKETHVRLNLVCDMGALTSNNNFTTIYTREMFVMSLRTPYACPKYVGDETQRPPAGADTENIPATNEQTHVPVGPGPAASLPVSPVPSAPPSGLSGGSIFLIMLAVFIPLYIGIGCFYKSQHLGTTGLESCPHYSFWQSVPRYVHDGCLFSYRYIQSLFNRDHERPNREEYDGL